MNMRLWPSLLGDRTPSGPKTAGDAATVRATGGYNNTWSSLDGMDVDQAVKRHYERVLWVFRCCDVIATKASSRPIVFRQGERTIEAPEAQDRDLNRLLNKRPNNYETAAQFRYRLSTLGLLSKRGVFIEVVKSRSGGYAELHILPPGRVRPIPDAERYVAGYEVSNGVTGIDYLDPEQVLWIKLKPHPTDPYMQMTPLQAAGIVADTDYLARVFNRNFLMNDGRPGMLITVQDLNPDDADVLQGRFSGGGSMAGKTTVIEGNGLDVADLSTSPRDAQWTESLITSKQDILLAFGVPESVMGNASERTFSNADAEDVGFWVHTMDPHMDAIGQSFDTLTAGGLDDDVFVVHDTSDIYSLQAVTRAREESARGEFEAGLITLNDYLKMKGLDPVDAPEANVRWMSPGLVPIGESSLIDQIQQRAQQQQAQEAAAENGQSAEAVEGGPQQQQVPATTQTVGEVQQGPVRRIGSQLIDLSAQVTQDLEQARQQRQQVNDQLRQLLAAGKRAELPRSNRPSAGIKRPRQHKSLQQVTKADEPDSEHDQGCTEDHTEHPYETERVKLEALFAGLTNDWSSRQLNVLDNRLKGVKARKGTRHWEPMGTKALDADYVVDRTRWANDLRDTIIPELHKVVREQMAKAYEDVGLNTPTAGFASDTVLDDLATFVTNSAMSQSGIITTLITEAEQRKMSLDDIRERVRDLNKVRTRWIKKFTTQLVTAAVEGARSFVADQIGGMRKTWHGVMDDRTRATHRRLHGRTVNVNNAFSVDGVKIRYPGDPLAPIGMTANCRCWLTLSPKGV